MKKMVLTLWAVHLLYLMLMLSAIYDVCVDDLYPIPSTELGWAYESVEQYVSRPLAYILVIGIVFVLWKSIALPDWYVAALLMAAFFVGASPIPKFIAPTIPELNGTICIYRDKTTFHEALQRDYQRKQLEHSNQ
jgi:hypothetical protein